MPTSSPWSAPSSWSCAPSSPATASSPRSTPGARASGASSRSRCRLALVIITGYVLASAPPVYRLIRALAAVPKSPRTAVALVTLFALLSSWLNWGFSLIFSAVLAREVARRVEADYRALCAASFLGVGSVWAQGLSGSAALQMATPGLLQPETRAIIAHGDLVPGGIVPLTHTIFLWQSLLSVGVELVLVTGLMYLVTPPQSRARTAQDLGIDLGSELGPAPAPGPAAPAEAPPRPGPVARVLAPPHPAHRAPRRHLRRALLRRLDRGAQRHQPQHPQPVVPLPRHPPARHAGPPHARRAGGHARGVGRHPAVSLLCRHRRRDHRCPPQRAHRRPVRAPGFARHAAAHRRPVLGPARHVCALGGIEVGDRGAVRHGGGPRPARPSRLDGGGL